MSKKSSKKRNISKTVPSSTRQESLEGQLRQLDRELSTHRTHFVKEYVNLESEASLQVKS